MHDLAIRNGVIAGAAAAEIAVEVGIIAAIGDDVGAAREELDALGLTIFPGTFAVSPHGVSHHPAETVYESDVDAARSVGAAFLAELERTHA